MSFWSDASPVVKGAIAVGAAGGLYLLVAFIAGMAPFGKKCDDSEPHAADATCIDGAWVRQERGFVAQ